MIPSPRSVYPTKADPLQSYSPPHPPTTPAHSTSYPGANPYPTLKDQKAFEKGLLEKTAKSTQDIILYDNRIVLFKTESDIQMFVVGSAEENEILLYSKGRSTRSRRRSMLN